MNDYTETLQQSDFFTVTTEKVVSTVEGSPWKAMLKVSTYSIKTGQAIRGHEPRLSWGRIEGRFVHHLSNGRTYVLAMLDKSAGFGKSEFIPISDVTGEVRLGQSYQKRDIKQYLKNEPFEDGAFPLPLDSITELVVKKVRLPEAEPTARPNDGYTLPF